MSSFFSHKKILKNFFAFSVSIVIRMGEQFFLVPLFLHCWGIDRYGEWLTLTAIPSCLFLANLGFGNVIQNSFVVAYCSNDNKEEAAKIAKSGLAILSTLIALLCLGVFAVLSWMWKVGLFNHLRFSATDVWITLVLLISARIIDFLAPYSCGLFFAAEKAAFYVNIGSFFQIIRLVAIAVVIYYSGDIVLLGVVNLGISLFIQPLYITIGFIWLKFNPWKYSAWLGMKDILIMLKKGMAYFAEQISQAFGNQLLTLAIRIAIGPAAVAIFNTTRTYSRLGTQFNSLLKQAIFPELQQLLCKKRSQSARVLFNVMVVSSTLSTAAIGFLLYVFSSFIFRIWVKNHIPLNRLLLGMLLTSIVFNALWCSGVSIFAAVNKPERYGIVYSILSVLLCLSSYFSALWFGLPGVAGSVILFEMAMFIGVAPGILKILQINFHSWMRTMFPDCKTGILSLLDFIRLNLPKRFQSIINR